MASLIENVLSALGGTAASVASGPVGAIGGLATLVNGIIDRVSPDPQVAAQMKVQLVQLDQQGHFKEIDAAIEQGKTDASVLVAEQATIAAEAAGKGGWLQANWHALGSLWAIGLLSAVYFVLPMMEKAVPAIPESAWMMLAAILGVAAWHSGTAAVQAVKNQA